MKKENTKEINRPRKEKEKEKKENTKEINRPRK